MVEKLQRPMPVRRQFQSSAELDVDLHQPAEGVLIVDAKRRSRTHGVPNKVQYAFFPKSGIVFRVLMLNPRHRFALKFVNSAAPQRVDLFFSNDEQARSSLKKKAIISGQDLSLTNLPDFSGSCVGMQGRPTPLSDHRIRFSAN